MKVRALTQFSTERDLVQIGDVLEMTDHVAEIRIASGLVERVGEASTPEAAEVERPEVEEAVTSAPEMAVSRPKKGARK